LQNQGFLLVFAHFLALDFGKRSVENLQTQRAMFVNTACRVCQRPTFRCQIRRFKRLFSTFFVVCNNGKKKEKYAVQFLYAKLFIPRFGRI